MHYLSNIYIYICMSTRFLGNFNGFGKLKFLMSDFRKKNNN